MKLSLVEPISQLSTTTRTHFVKQQLHMMVNLNTTRFTAKDLGIGE